MLGRCCLEVLRQLIQLELPELPIAFDPHRCVSHWRGHERRPARAPFAPDPSQPCALQYPNVLGHGRERHVELGRQLADGPVAGRESRQDRSARRIRERRKGAVEDGLMVNHVV